MDIGFPYPVASDIVINNVPSRSTARLRKALARVRMGTGRAKIAIFGDSIPTGYGVGSPSAYAGARVGAWPNRLAKALAARGLPALCENITGEANQGAAGYNAYDPRATGMSNAGTDWGYDATRPSFGKYMFRRDLTGGAAFSFTPIAAVDTFVVSAYRYSGGGGTVGVTIAGAAPSSGGSSMSAVWNGSTPDMLTTVFTGASKAVQALALTKTNALPFHIAGIYAYDSTTPAVDIFNFGWPGSNTTNWNDATGAYSPKSRISSLLPDVVIIALGPNDWNGATPNVAVATYKSNVVALVVAAQAIGADVILVAPAPSNPAIANIASQVIQSAYVETLKQVANDNGCLMISQHRRLETWDLGNAAGYMFDEVHPNGLAAADLGSFIAETLLAA